MKKISLLLLFISISISGYSQLRDSIHFLPITFDEAIVKAKADKKPIFLHAYASWCHYCSEMTEKVYTDINVANFYNKNFINIKMDMEKEGKNLNKKLKVQNFPAHIFFDYPATTMMHREAGKKDVLDFITLGYDALDTTKQLRTFERKYFSKTATVPEIYTYFKMLDRAGLDNQTGVNSYLLGLSDEELLKQENWRIMYDLFKDVDMPAFNRVILNKDAYQQIYTEDSIDNKILGVYNGALMTRVQKLDTLGYNDMISKLGKSKLVIADKIIAYAHLNRAKMKSDWKNYQELAVPFIEKFCQNDYRRLNEVAYNYYERVIDREQLVKAEAWAKAAVKMGDNVRHNYTLACIQYKLQKKEDAMIVCKHTIYLAKMAGVESKTADLLLEKIEALKSTE
jgi:thiol-disulfide isomerase/thioredoxin